MALTRKGLKAMGLTEEQVDSIVEMHTEVTEALKSERDEYKLQAEKYTAVQEELDTAKQQLASTETDPFKVKYDALKEEYTAYKTAQQEKEAKAEKEKAYRGLLKDAGLNEKRIDAVLKVSDINAIDFDENGEVKGKADILENIKKEWADFIVTSEQRGASTATPPADSGKTVLSKTDIYKKDEHGRYVLSASERQRAIAESLKSN